MSLSGVPYVLLMSGKLHSLQVKLLSMHGTQCCGTFAACAQQGIVFVPLHVETLGAWHFKAAEQIKKIARAKGRSKGQDEDKAVCHLFQQLAVTLVKGNTALLNARVPNLSPHLWMDTFKPNQVLSKYLSLAPLMPCIGT